MFGFGKRSELFLVDTEEQRRERVIKELRNRIKCLENEVFLLKNPKEAEKKYIEELVEKVNRGHNDNFYAFKRYSENEITRMKKEIADYYSRKEK